MSEPTGGGGHGTGHAHARSGRGRGRGGGRSGTSREANRAQLPGQLEALEFQFMGSCILSKLLVSYLNNTLSNFQVELLTPIPLSLTSPLTPYMFFPVQEFRIHDRDEI